ncbi:bifunctional YncE family protein/alkaline phosphatase family protein [Phnomibacter sp. MR]|uniref:bifunctional YncE family protein/alkaline phosphatase family protein n=1 Tax=Phnomibacter sp. MR TaxID=3042318 RepID=UPI003A81351A
MFRILASVVLLAVCLQAMAQSNPFILSVPGVQQYANIDTAGISVLPSGRYVTPVGQTIRITHDPFGMAVSPDGKTVITLHNGVFSIIDVASMQATRVPDYAGNIPSPLSNGSFLGVAFHPTQSLVYLSGGDNGAVIVYDYKRLQKVDSISLNGTFAGKLFDDSFTSDLIFNTANNELLVLDRGNFRLVRINLANKKITASIETGRQPFGLAISPDKKTVLVANVGMYSYPLVKGATPENANEKMIDFHPYGDNTKASKEGTIIDGKEIPGVGDPNAPEAMSVYSINLATNKVMHRLKTGHLIGELVEDAEVIGGASPNSIVMGKQFAYVTNATNDNISVIDYRKGKIVDHINIKVDPLLDKYRGLLPFGITMSADEKTLYVALLGFNAVAVIDIASKTTKGLLPTGWGPARVLLSKEQQYLYVISCRGYGAGPNGGKNFVAPPQGTYVGDIQLATFQKIAMPDAVQLKAYTTKAIQNTYQIIPVSQVANTPLPALPGLGTTPIKHIVFISKENRTYDEVFGQMSRAKGDATLARFGTGVNIFTKTDSLYNVDVMPNHKRIGSQFAFSDNFYCDSDASIHGHHWMVGVIPNEWVEANSSVNKTAKLFSNAPGRRFPGSTGSIDPEDYAEIGGLWEALERKGISFFNFGQANETAHVREEWNDTATGAAHLVMVPMQNALWTRTSHNFAGYNTNIPDQFRMKQFEEEFTKKWLNGKDTMPQLLTVMLPNDHGARPRPEDGYPFTHSYMADNDLALGRMLHFLSRTPYWKDMLVIVTEDDPQGGVDHIDGHRSILMMAGPYVKKNHVSHTHANFGTILKTMYNILGVPYVNQYDVTASLLSDFFTNTPDFSTYDFVLPDKRVFDWDKAMEKYKQPIDWRKIQQGPKMDDAGEQRVEHYKTGGQ